MVALLFVHPADACLIAPPDEFELAPDPLDVTPPTPPVLGEVEVTRVAGRLVPSSCADFVGVDILALRPPGDPDRNDDVGYYVDVVDGDAPFDPIEPIAGPIVSLAWSSDQRGPLAFTLSLTPVDRAGNEGEPVTVVVEDRGCGCGVAGGSPLGAASAAAWLLARRARTRFGRRS